MADGTPDDNEKTEEPTERKLQEAHRKGDVAKSQEVPMFTVLLAMFVLSLFAVQPVSSGIASLFAEVILHAGTIEVSGSNLSALTQRLGTDMLLLVIPPMAALAVGAVLGNLVQHKPIWSLEPLKPKVSRVSLLGGVKRLFSGHSLMQLAKSVFKLALIAAVLIFVLYPLIGELPWMVSLPTTELPSVLSSLAAKIIGGTLAVVAIIAAADWLYQRNQWLEKQKMSIREIRDELKSSEGDPELRAKLRQIRAERSRKRMMQNVPNAAVVVTNPTHISVALQYDSTMTAPLCIAKGEDVIALRIREVAREAGVPIVQNVTLARALHETTEIDDYIPIAHYQAVAEVISYVMSRKRAGH